MSSDTVTHVSSAVDPELAAMINGVLDDYRATAAPVGAGTRRRCDRDFWQQLDSLGLVRLTGAERDGGSGAGWAEAAELITAAVRHGVHLPLAEHDLLACWLIDEVSGPAAPVLHTLCQLAPGSSTGLAPWAAEVDRLAVLWRADEGHLLAQIDTADVQITHGTNRIGEPRDRVTVDVSTLRGVAVPPEVADVVGRKSAMVRALQVCAALDHAVALSIEHAASRVQFGRPLAKFQAIQNLIADAAAEAALARIATEAALNTAIDSSWRAACLDFQIAVARSCAGQASLVVTRNAHQVHGAMGTTIEHRLHEYTRGALAWRSEFGSARSWDMRVAAAASTGGRSGLWEIISGT
ncbi:acyl-CoA dehydrogenase family protein [Mycobacterium sp. PSTR-4-N]|uniref:acyl-CoA dehydrogenase family protein n=1 Tax=Mycobacterium sp. PSTR-4-N TaxID=2917745 RepID=UPI001F14B9D5|nr:acyl-CoA dehydrogenase family protein [Mycobacterium sp. PSTR-4-N]MCG7592525.1 acyl-CoA dehydrogenase [Mycobacterium sp. PSTR-4-N]